MRSFARADGLWDIEGLLTDVWPEPVHKADGVLAGGQPMHAMHLRLTVDRTATIVAAEAAMDAGPYDAACSAIAPDYGQLVGVRVARGYKDAIRRLFGRTAGCTHVNELAGAMGSAILQALWHELAQAPDEKPFSIDGCHALAASGAQVARFFPRWHRPEPDAPGASPAA
ncbi:DUF2889 domain-containing protein [Aquabacterium sp. OR-4]|uniref:DUF2889 domain-containing protein n=1 Tax=Aquabacterium sp. OR-4 TaxID=2978127 RepID=UPI0028C9CBD4|nr:DUF2889 domain-containing protein [Aquabacterium sp. OR-4]MDT7838867.1 DUF2889 domain-containing protein [Aquabacterium sp. OR-4]